MGGVVQRGAVNATMWHDSACHVVGIPNHNLNAIDMIRSMSTPICYARRTLGRASET